MTNMAIYTPRQVMLWGAVLLVLAYIKSAEQAIIPVHSEEHNFSSIEHDESTTDNIKQVSQDEHQHKRSTDDSESDNVSPRLTIPGLPDPATLLKIAEVVQAVSAQVVPILVEGINAPAEIVTEHLNRDFKILNKLKSRLDLFSGIK